jgi:H+-transporting ATPase
MKRGHFISIFFIQNSTNTEEIKEFSLPELFQKLSSNEKGLTDSEAKKRLQIYGFNEIVEMKINPLIKFLSYFWGPIPRMIEIAAVLSGILHRWEDFTIILVLLMLNVTVSFWQEYKADNAIELLKQKLALKARVLRDNKWLEVQAREIVP